MFGVSSHRLVLHVTNDHFTVTSTQGVALFGIHNLFHPDYVANVLIGVLNREMDHAAVRDRTAPVHLSGSIQKKLADRCNTKLAGRE
jgi:hypothetical protein